MVGEERTEHLFPTGQRQNMYFLSWTWATPKLTPVTRLEQTGADQGRDLLPLSIPRAAVRKTERETPAGSSDREPYRTLPGRRRLSYQIIHAPTGSLSDKKIISHIHIIESSSLVPPAPVINKPRARLCWVV